VCPVLTMLKKRKGFTIIELLVVVLILAVLTAVALPLYLRSVSESEIDSCKTNMSSIASAEQAQRVRDVGAYYSGDVDDASTADNGPLRDLHNAIPHCPGDISEHYTVAAAPDGGFIVRCNNPKHRFQWHNSVFENY
jgi:prepilin-type N-terminal cleavage/methylation domain-containing protein